MKIVIITFWLLIPLGVVAYHYNAGEKHVEQDQAQELIEQAYQYTKDEEPKKAIDSFREAIALLSDDEKKTERRLRLEIIKIQLNNAGLVKATKEITALLGEMKEDKGVDTDQLREARSIYASTRYHMAYLMKLEDLPKEYWEPEIEAARQEYKMLATECESAGDKEAAEGYLEDLETSIRLARAELPDLQGRKIPVP